MSDWRKGAFVFALLWSSSSPAGNQRQYINKPKTIAPLLCIYFEMCYLIGVCKFSDLDIGVFLRPRVYFVCVSPE